MTVTEHMIWFIATAIAIIAVLLVGTLAAADLLPLRAATRTRERSEQRDPGDSHERRVG